MPISLPMLSTCSASSTPSVPDEVHAGDRLVDSHGRTIHDLRLSVTDRCNMRCVYCMDPDATFVPRSELLTADELIRLASICVGLGVDRVRITGGEPTVRGDLEEVIAGVSELGVRDISMTTNGAGLRLEQFNAWRAAGLNRVTFSLDSLDADKYKAITRSRWTPADVIEAMEHAAEAGLEPIRFNCVVVRGSNDHEIVPLVELARRLGAELRLIEFMPLDGGHRWNRREVVTSAETLELIRQAIPLEPIGRERKSATAHRFAFADGSPGGVGLISPVSDAFCGACSRLRITADGKVRACLFGEDQGDLRAPLRDGASDGVVRRHLQEIVWRKRKGHGIGTESFQRPEQSMNGIGG